MSISVYYVARRNQSLTTTEQTAIKNAVERYAVEDQLLERERTREGLNCESFCIYDSNDPSEPGVVFEGATKLPDNSENAIRVGLHHWCHLLTDIRRSIQGASWRVHVDDHDLVWDEDRREYDPTQ